eukprot:2179330-Prymnesium_polylepis.2
MNGHAQCAHALLGAGARKAVRAATGDTAFSLARDNGHSEIGELLKAGHGDAEADGARTTTEERVDEAAVAQPQAGSSGAEDAPAEPEEKCVVS